MDNLATLFSSKNLAAPSLGDLLQQRFIQLQQQQPKLRRREVAEQLQVPEAALIDSQCGVNSIRLEQSFADIIQQLPSLGYIMSLTRNDSAVHERKGSYEKVSIKGPMGLVINDDRKIDLRIFLNRWASGFAVQESITDGFRYSLQFFDQAGTAIQKIFLQSDSDADAYQALVEKFALADNDQQPLQFSDIAVEPSWVDTSHVDEEKLQKDWLAMTNVHQFFSLMKKYKVSREQEFSLVEDSLAQPIEPALIAELLQKIAATDLSIMCFVGNKGNIQIHTGTIQNVKKMGPWLNILDPEFNLHLLEDNVASAWVVRKPTVDGNITSVELYDAAGETILQLFGQRGEGEAENRRWRDMVETLLVGAAVA